MNKALLIVGGTGFVGQAAAKFAVQQGIKVFSLSPSGTPRVNNEWTSQITYLKGDALDHSAYQDVIKECNAVIHSVGVLIDARTPLNVRNVYQGSYEHMNRDTAFKICELMQNQGKRFVYLSAERGMFFSPRYLSTKREVEQFLEQNQESLQYAVVRPGVMYDDADRMRNTAACLVDIINKGDVAFEMLGLKNLGNQIIPARSLHVDVVGKVAVLAAFREELVNKTLDVEDIEHTDRTFYAV